MLFRSVSLQAPPLRDRKSDIPLLANYFLERFCAINNKQIEGISRDAMELLCAYDWPGNCRELANIIEHAVVFCRAKSLTREFLPAQIQPATPTVTPVGSTAIPTLAEAECALIRKALEDSNWNLKMAAEALDIARGTLYSKIEKYHLHKPD